MSSETSPRLSKSTAGRCSKRCLFLNRNGSQLPAPKSKQPLCAVTCRQSICGTAGTLRQVTRLLCLRSVPGTTSLKITPRSLTRNLEVLRWEHVDGSRQGATVDLVPLDIKAAVSVKSSPLTTGSIPLVSGAATDQSIFGALMSEHTNQLNAAIIPELLLAATEQTTITVPSKDGNSNNVYDQILALCSIIAETTNQRSDVVIMSPHRWRCLLANTRLASNRLIAPSEVTDTPPVPCPAGWIGTQKLPVYVDLNMQPGLGTREQGSEDKIIVACRQDMHLFQPYYLMFRAKQTKPDSHEMFRFSITTNQAYFSARLGNNTTGVIAGPGMNTERYGALTEGHIIHIKKGTQDTRETYRTPTPKRDAMKLFGNCHLSLCLRFNSFRLVEMSLR